LKVGQQQKLITKNGKIDLKKTKPFFEKSAFIVESKNIVKKDKIELVNYIMTREIFKS